MKGINKNLSNIIRIFVLTFLICITLNSVKTLAISKIISNIDIMDISGMKISREECSGVFCGDNETVLTRYKLLNVPENISLIDAKIVHKGVVYTFSQDERVLLDKEGNEVRLLEEDKYTIKLNTKELGSIYKIVSKNQDGYKFIDVKFDYNKYSNTFNIVGHNPVLKDAMISIFKDDKKIGETKVCDDGKASIYVSDIENLETSTYTVLIKKGSEIIGIDAFHATPTYRNINLASNVDLSVTSNISNKIKVVIKGESGITVTDKVYVTQVYEESNPNENLLVDLDYTKNQINNLYGEITLKNVLNKDKKYKVKFKINGMDISAEDDINIVVCSLDISKIKVSVVEEISKDLVVDLSGIETFGQEDKIEAVCFYDIKNKDRNLIEQTDITNKVNHIYLDECVSFGNSYEFVLSINDFILEPLGVEVINVDIDSAVAITDILSSKIFISLENAKGFKVTDKINVHSVFREGEETANYLKSEYNTLITNLNGTVFLNANLDTKNNYFVKFKVNDILLEKVLKVTVNNNISFDGASIKSDSSSYEVRVDFKNVDSINNNDLIEVIEVFDLKNKERNLLDTEKDNKLYSKQGKVFLKEAILSSNVYGLRLKINGVEFEEIIQIEIEEGINIDRIKPYSIENNKLVLDFKNTSVSKTDRIHIISLKSLDVSENFILDKINDLEINEEGKIFIDLKEALEESGKYKLVFNIIRNNVTKEISLEFQNHLITNNMDQKDESLKEEIALVPIETEDNSESLKVEQEIDLNRVNLSRECIEIFDIFLEFNHNIENEGQINKIECNINGSKVNIKDGKVVVSNLIPMKVYKNVEICLFKDEEIIRKFFIEESEMLESENSIKNFIANTYVNIKSNPNAKNCEFVYGDEEGYYFWYENIVNKKSTIREFILNLLNEEEFLNKHKNISDKVKVLYKVIFTIDPSEQSLDIWVNEFNKNIENGDIQSALKTTVEKMFTNCKFKALEKQLK